MEKMRRNLENENITFLCFLNVATPVPNICALGRLHSSNLIQ